MSAPLLSVDLRLPLDGFELEVAFEATERVTGVFGVSGSGKTSLLESIAGLRQARGTIRHGSEDWLNGSRSVPPDRRNLGYVPQDGLLFPDRSVRDNLLAGRGRARRRGHDVDQLFANVVDLLELSALLERAPSQLSGGERQRVALGRAICSGPSLLLLDEPLAALDLGLRRRLLPFLRRLNEELAIPSLLVSHDPIEMLALCDDMLVLHAGRIVARGRPDEVLTDPAVYPMGERQSLENVLLGTLIETRGGTSRVRLGSGEAPIDVVTVAVRAEPGAEVMLGLPAHDVMLATEEPRGLSARNVIPATIVRERVVGTVGLVTVSTGEGHAEWTVEVTDTTPKALGVSAGSRVYLVFKATSCRIYGEQSAPLP